MFDDPDNPPLKPDAVWVPWEPRFHQKVAQHRARWLARQADDLTFENEINYRFGHSPAYERPAHHRPQRRTAQKAGRSLIDRRTAAARESALGNANRLC
jgi:hypothetical protein